MAVTVELAGIGKLGKVLLTVVCTLHLAASWYKINVFIGNL